MQQWPSMTPEYINILLKLTKAQSANVVAATTAHLCEGITQTRAAERYGVEQSAIARLVKRIRELDQLVDAAISEKSK